jgi:hypothetical protein
MKNYIENSSCMDQNKLKYNKCFKFDYNFFLLFIFNYILNELIIVYLLSNSTNNISAK